MIDETEHNEENIKKRIERCGQADYLRIFSADGEGILTQATFKVFIIDGSKMDKSILPVVGPADNDVNYLYACRE